jgi:hypothetical protein
MLLLHISDAVIKGQSLLLQDLNKYHALLHSNNTIIALIPGKKYTKIYKTLGKMSVFTLLKN